VERRQFLLTYVQPGLAGLMDGSVSTLAPIFAAAFAVAVAIQIRAERFHPFLYWFTIIATTTVGTSTTGTAADRIGASATAAVMSTSDVGSNCTA